MEFNATLIGQMITFGLLVWFTMKFVWPPIIQAMNERQTKIADGLAAAEQGAQAQELAAAKAEELVKEARVQAQEIIRQADKRATDIVEESKSTARSEGEKQLLAAQAEISQEANRAREQLRQQVAQLAVAGAGRVLGREVDVNAHNQLLEELVSQL